MGLRSCCTAKVLLGCSLVSIALLIVSLVLALKVFPDIIEDEIDKSVRLEEDTEQFDRFEELPFPMEFKVYIWTVKNPDDILNGAKPDLEEVGPYVYKQYRKKNITEINDDDDTITYTQGLTFEFDAEASGDLTEDDRLVVANPPYTSLLQLGEDTLISGTLPGCMQYLFPGAYNNFFIEIPVKELLFDGLEFCNLNANPLPPECGLCFIACSQASTKRNIDMIEPGNVNAGLRYSYLNYKRRAPDGVYTVMRGIDDISTLGQIATLDGNEYTAIWGKKNTNLTCDKVRGTDSTIYAPHIEDDQILEIYSTDLCRAVDISYFDEDTYQDIDGYKFGTTEMTLRSANPEEDCFCPKLTKDTDGQFSCFLDGVMDMQPCLGAPILLSFPHFLWADEKYLNGVDGLAPNEDDHRIFLLVEPNTGTPLHGARRIQMNLVLRPIANAAATANIKGVVLPLIWLDEGVSLTEEYVDKLNDDYFSKKQLVDGVQWALVALSCVLILIFCSLFVKKQFFK